jgi:hypothetical protein
MLRQFRKFLQGATDVQVPGVLAPPRGAISMLCFTTLASSRSGLFLYAGYSLLPTMSL